MGEDLTAMQVSEVSQLSFCGEDGYGATGQEDSWDAETIQIAGR